MDIMVIAADDVTSRDLNPFFGLVCDHLCLQDGMDGLPPHDKQRALDTRRAPDFLSFSSFRISEAATRAPSGQPIIIPSVSYWFSINGIRCPSSVGTF